MGNQRILLYFTLFFIVYLIWAQWQMDYGPKLNTVADKQVIESQDAQIPVADRLENKIESISPPENTNISTGEKILVETDVLKVEIDTQGGDLIKLTLLNYSYTAEDKKDKLVLFTNHLKNFQIAQSGLVSANKNSAPTHKALYQSEKKQYQLTADNNQIEVPLYWQNNEGVTVKKVITFTRNSYEIKVNYYIKAGNEKWVGSDYMQIVSAQPEDSSNVMIHTYTGAVIYNDELKYEKIDFDDIAEKNLNNQYKDGWLAMIRHYFLAAWIPEKGKTNLYFTRYNNNNSHYTVGSRSSAITIEPEKTAQISSRLVVGPKLQYKLEELEPGLELTVDYGILTIFAKPLFWLLNFFHEIFANWGWAIIFLTITVKAIFYKLSEMSYRSMAKMRKVAPRIKQMKEHHGDDRQAMSKAMMDMYKREKINPMGGCLPILVQMPVFISLYWVLLESVEIRHAPFALWITNLTAQDPYFVLPVLMGISMFVQQKLNPAPVDPIQQKIFQVMPFAFTIMFAFFPSGLVLYWVVNNILSITQQYFITKKIENS